MLLASLAVIQRVDAAAERSTAPRQTRGTQRTSSSDPSTTNNVTSYNESAQYSLPAYTITSTNESDSNSTSPPPLGSLLGGFSFGQLPSVFANATQQYLHGIGMQVDTAETSTPLEALVENVKVSLEQAYGLPPAEKGVYYPQVAQGLCSFLEGRMDAFGSPALDWLSFDAYEAAWPLMDGGRVPDSCPTGCVIAMGEQVETVTRTWESKCFSNVRRDARGRLIEADVLNLMRVGPRLLPLFPGKVYIGPSRLYDSETAIIIDYSSEEHVFSNYVDEIREVSPGFYLGQLFSTNGIQGTWSGYRLHFVLFETSETGQAAQRTAPPPSPPPPPFPPPNPPPPPASPPPPYDPSQTPAVGDQVTCF